jgi:periplasmic copper chaperone A
MRIPSSSCRLAVAAVAACSLLTLLPFQAQAQALAGGAAVQAPLPTASAAVQVSAPWVRATVPGQGGSGAFMTLTARTATRLVGVSSPVAGIAEVHEMKMDGNVMKMGPVAGIDLPAGKAVELKSGGYHVMLMDLKRTLASGASVPLALRFRDAAGAESTLNVNVPVQSAAPGAEAAGAGTHDHAHGHQH